MFESGYGGLVVDVASFFKRLFSVVSVAVPFLNVPEIDCLPCGKRLTSLHRSWDI